MNTPLKRSHLYLQNDRNTNPTFKVYGGPVTKKPTDAEAPQEDFDGEEPLELTPAEISAQQQILRSDAVRLKREQAERYERRSPQLVTPAMHIDYITVHFQKTCTKKLQEQFKKRFGLRPRVFFNLNRSVTFSVVTVEQLNRFLATVEEYAQETRTSAGSLPSIEEDVFPYITGFDLLTTERMLAQGFELDSVSTQTVAPTLHVVSLELFAEADDRQRAVRDQLLAFLTSHAAAPRYYAASETIEVSQVAPDILRLALDNFDIIHRVQSVRLVRIAPGELGTVVRTNPISLTPNSHAPIVGVIDTGVFPGTGLAPVIVSSGYCLDHSSLGTSDNAGHGTAVAGLVAIGEQLFSNNTVFDARARILPIKVIEQSGDGCSPDAIAEVILTAHKDKGVRLFTLCLNHAVQPYNSSPSHYAFVLDKLAWEHDLLIFISTGNLSATEVAQFAQQTTHAQSYPNFFSNPSGVPGASLPCEATNLLTPAEALNHLSVGAIAHNFTIPLPTAGLTPAFEYPAIYTRKSHYDYTQPVNGIRFLKTQANKQLHKPDVVYAGGDLSLSTGGPIADVAGIEVLTNDTARPFVRQAGTSFAAPLVASIAAQILQRYPSLSTQTVKALLLNGSRSPIASASPPHFRHRNGLLERLIGRGKPNLEHVLFSNDNRVTFVIEEEIKTDEFKYIELKLPHYWIKSAAEKNFKLRFTGTLCYAFPPTQHNHLHYCPLHISFCVFRSPADCKPASDLRSDAQWMAEVQKENYSLSSVAWSSEVKGIDNALLSNTQKMEFNLQPTWFLDDTGSLTSTTLCLAVRSRVKKEAGDLARLAAVGTNKFSLVVTLEELPRNQKIARTGQLYNALEALNDVQAIADLNAEGEIILDA